MGYRFHTQSVMDQLLTQSSAGFLQCCKHFGNSQTQRCIKKVLIKVIVFIIYIPRITHSEDAKFFRAQTTFRSDLLLEIFLKKKRNSFRGIPLFSFIGKVWNFTYSFLLILLEEMPYYNLY